MEDGIRGELPERLGRLRSIVERRGLDGLIVYGDAGHAGNVRYLTNYAPFFGPAVFVLDRGGESRLLVSFDWEIPRALQASGMDEIEAASDVPSLVGSALDTLGLTAGARLGLVGRDIIPYPIYMTLAARCPEPTDVDEEFRELRIIKSPLEQEMLRRAAAATDAALEALPLRVRAGMTEIEVAAALDFEMRRAGAQGFAFSSAASSGSNTERPVNLPTGRRLEPGDFLMVDIGGVWEGYQADITRTFVVGGPTARQREVYDIVRRTLEATTAMSRPGVPMTDLHRKATVLLAEHDLAQFFTHRVGHGIGLETSLEPIDLRRDETELRPGMTFCIEPGVYIPGFGGVKIEDDVIVKEGEPEVISHASRELISI
jgi:Xaa-Pro aminopeptidase